MPEEPKENPEPNSFGDFCERFNALMVEAQAYGLATAFAICDISPLSQDEERALGFRGGSTQAIGLFEWAKNRLLSPEDDE